MSTEAEEIELSPRVGMLFGLVKPHAAPTQAPRRRHRLRHEDHADELGDDEAPIPKTVQAKGHRRQLLAWLKAGRVPRTTSECGELVQLASQTVIHDLMALERRGRVVRGTREVVRGDRPGRRTVQTWSFVK